MIYYNNEPLLTDRGLVIEVNQKGEVTGEFVQDGDAGVMWRDWLDVTFDVRRWMVVDGAGELVWRPPFGSLFDGMWLDGGHDGGGGDWTFGGFNQLVWPTGASRWGWFVGLMERGRSAELGYSGTLRITTDEVSGDVVKTVDEIETQMYLLVRQPLTLEFDGVSLDLLVFVDERYGWQRWNVDKLDQGESEGPVEPVGWDELIQGLASAMELDLNYSEVDQIGAIGDGVWGMAPPLLRMAHHYVGELWDCIARSVGRRFVRQLNGQCDLQTASEMNDVLSSERDRLHDCLRAGGDVVWDLGPDNWGMTFFKHGCQHWPHRRYIELRGPNEGNELEKADWVVNNTAQAVYDANGNLTNTGQISDILEAWGEYFSAVNWNGNWSYIGVRHMDVSGAVDRVVWCHKYVDVGTMVWGGAGWNEGTRGGWLYNTWKDVADSPGFYGFWARIDGLIAGTDGGYIWSEVQASAKAQWVVVQGGLMATIVDACFAYEVNGAGADPQAEDEVEVGTVVRMYYSNVEGEFHFATSGTVSGGQGELDIVRFRLLAAKGLDAGPVSAQVLDSSMNPTAAIVNVYDTVGEWYGEIGWDGWGIKMKDRGGAPSSDVEILFLEARTRWVTATLNANYVATGPIAATLVKEWGAAPSGREVGGPVTLIDENDRYLGAGLQQGQTVVGVYDEKDDRVVLMDAVTGSEGLARYVVADLLANLHDNATASATVLTYWGGTNPGAAVTMERATFGHYDLKIGETVVGIRRTGTTYTVVEGRQNLEWAQLTGDVDVTVACQAFTANIVASCAGGAVQYSDMNFVARLGFSGKLGEIYPCSRTYSGQYVLLETAKGGVLIADGCAVDFTVGWQKLGSTDFSKTVEKLGVSSASPLQIWAKTVEDGEKWLRMPHHTDGDYSLMVQSPNSSKPELALHKAPEVGDSMTVGRDPVSGNWGFVKLVGAGEGEENEIWLGAWDQISAGGLWAILFEINDLDLTDNGDGSYGVGTQYLRTKNQVPTTGGAGQCMMGLTIPMGSGTVSFTDNAGNGHQVTIDGGLVSSWKVNGGEQLVLGTTDPGEQMSEFQSDSVLPIDHCQ